MNASSIDILLIEDDVRLAELTATYLEQNGLRVQVEARGDRAMDAFTRDKPRLVLLDLLLPGKDGLSICRELRRVHDVPILILTAKDTDLDHVIGLEAGADDYVMKPVDPMVLLARVRALLRRAEVPAQPDAALRFDDLELDPVAYTVRRGERGVELTRTEFALLELFLRHPRQVLTRSVIFDRVWGYDFGPASNSLEVYVGYLRRKTEAGGEPRLLHTVRGIGYVLRAP